MRVFSGLPSRKLCFRENALIPDAPAGIVAAPAQCAPDGRGLGDGRHPIRFVHGGLRRGVQRGNPSGLRDFAEVHSKLPASRKPVKQLPGPLRRSFGYQVTSRAAGLRPRVNRNHPGCKRPLVLYRPSVFYSKYEKYRICIFYQKCGLSVTYTSCFAWTEYRLSVKYTSREKYKNCVNGGNYITYTNYALYRIGA
jgi:hypothetical protein